MITLSVVSLCEICDLCKNRKQIINIMSIVYGAAYPCSRIRKIYEGEINKNDEKMYFSQRRLEEEREEEINEKTSKIINTKLSNPKMMSA